MKVSHLYLMGFSFRKLAKPFCKSFTLLSGAWRPENSRKSGKEEGSGEDEQVVTLKPKLKFLRIVSIVTGSDIGVL
jgi:hypothetical protein